MLIKCVNPEAVVRRAFYLAWKAAGTPRGMGMLRDRPGATETEVFENATNRGDYPGGSRHPLDRPDEPGEAYGDYVFGRMMKLVLRWTAEGVEMSDAAPRPDYQSWCNSFPTYAALVSAAVDSLMTAPAPLGG